MAVNERGWMLDELFFGLITIVSSRPDIDKHGISGEPLLQRWRFTGEERRVMMSPFAGGHPMLKHSNGDILVAADEYIPR